MWGFVAIECVQALVGVVTSAVRFDPLQASDPIVAMTAMASLQLLEWVAFLAFGIPLLLFLLRAHRNAGRIAGTPLVQSGPAMVAWFVVPIASLLLPFYAVREIWETSTVPGFPAPPIPESFARWWQAWIAAWLLAPIWRYVGTVDALGGALLRLACSAAIIHAAMQAFDVVRRIDRAQRRAWGERA